MLKFLKSLYLSSRLYYLIFAIALMFMGSFWWNELYPIIWVLVFLIVLSIVVDISLLFRGNLFFAERLLPDKFSNSDLNKVMVSLENSYPIKLKVEIIDEIPEQFQKRDFLKTALLNAGERKEEAYFLQPYERGEYVFGKLNIYVQSLLGLVKRRYAFQDQQKVNVYPSIIQMKKYEFLAIDNRIFGYGFKKIRRIGHTMEFEQVKDYVRGDDIRTINWKATAKRGSLMVNQYQDEKSQAVYSIIDTGRVMKMPFEGLKLLDYAINSSLAFSNIALKKKDKVGLVTYTHEVTNFLPATNRSIQLNKILESLYAVDTQFKETDLALLYAQLKRKVTRRSLIMLYTNFEHFSSLKRQLPYLKAIAKKHLLVVIFFENTELEELLEKSPDNTPEIYDQIIARQFKDDKERMLKELTNHGIQAVLTPPKELSVQTINKYLELKSRGLL